MKINASTRATIAALAVAGVGMIAAAAPASAECRPYQTATASGIFKSTTGIQARNSWRFAVTAKAGIAYALWSKARNASTVCRKGKESNWHCTARGRPCS